VHILSRAALIGFSFAIGFGVLASAIWHFAPSPRVSAISEKLAWLATHPRDFDVLVVGSSRLRQIVPEVFETELRAVGMPCETFNLSADGMRPPEDAYVFERALEVMEGPLRFVLIEANPIALRYDEEEEGTERLLYWHDTARLAAIWDRALAQAIKGPLRIGRRISELQKNAWWALGHTRYWLWNATRVGYGSELLQDALGMSAPAILERDLGARRDGYIPNDAEPVHGVARRAYLRTLKKKFGEGAQLDPMEGASQRHVQHMLGLARTKGARLVIVAPPTTVVKTFRPIIAPGSDTLFLDFSDPTLYPALFAPEVRLNGGHVTAEGSVLFTEMVAQRLAAEIASAPNFDRTH
jgi:hypothetical protein